MPIDGTQTVAAPIAPGSVADTYSTHIDEFGRGGYRSITTGGSGTATNAQIGAQVTLDRRKVGMLLFDTSTARYYRCTGTAGDGTYTLEDFGATGGSVTSVGLSMPTGFNVGNTPITSTGDLTVSTTLNGIIKGNGSGFVPAIAGTDYAAASHTQAFTTVNNLPTSRLVGRSTAGTGALEAITIGTWVNLANGTLTATGSGGTVTAISGVTPILSSTADEGATYQITHANSGVTAGTFGAAGTVPVVSVNATGHVTSVTTATISGFLPTAGGTLTGSLTGASASFTDLTVAGGLTVNGTTTTINSTTLTVDDKNIELGSVASPTNTTANGGGITLRGTTDKTLNWVSTTSAWTSSEDFNLLTGKTYEINGATVLSANALGTGVSGSSLTSVGALTSGSLGAGFTTVAVARGGTGATALTGLVKGNGAAAFTAAVAGTDYLSPNSVIDGGTY